MVQSMSLTDYCHFSKAYENNCPDILTIRGKIDLRDAVSQVIEELHKIYFMKSVSNVSPSSSPSTTLLVNINSGGGDLDVAFTIYECLQLLKKVGYRIITVSHGHCESAAVLIFLAGDVRRCFSKTCFLIHQLKCSFADIRIDLINEARILCDSRWNNLISEYMKYSKISRDELITIMEKDFRTEPEDMKSMGFVTEIIGDT